MSDRREHVLVLAEIKAGENGFRGETRTSGVAQELGVDRDMYMAYRDVCGAIDEYEHRHQGHEVLSGIPERPDTPEIEIAQRLIGYALDLHRAWRGSTGWPQHEVDEYARRILATTLTLKAQLEGRRLDLAHQRDVDVELSHEL